MDTNGGCGFHLKSFRQPYRCFYNHNHLSNINQIHLCDQKIIRKFRWVQYKYPSEVVKITRPGKGFFDLQENSVIESSKDLSLTIIAIKTSRSLREGGGGKGVFVRTHTLMTMEGNQRFK